jgi:hypothetical protein
MLDSTLFEIVDTALAPMGARAEAGVSSLEPPFEILRFYHRAVRLHWLPLLGRALSVVAVVREPANLTFSADSYRILLRRIAQAANGRFPPWGRAGGLSIGLTTLAIADQPIGQEDDATLQQALRLPARTRTSALGLIRMNLTQEAMAFALASGPGDLFPEPVALADALTQHFRRYVQPIEM